MNRRLIAGSFVVGFSFFCLACSPLEVVRLFGIGTKPFYRQGKVYTKTIDKDFFSSYDQVVKFFGQIQASYYRGSRREGFIVFTNLHVIFPQANQSTELAVFLQELETKKTKVEVSSLNHSLVTFVAEELFKKLN